MLRTLKRLFDETGGVTAAPAFERRQLRLAVATLLHESTRVDLESQATRAGISPRISRR